MATVEDQDRRDPRWAFHPGWDEEMRRAFAELMAALHPANDNGSPPFLPVD